MKIRKDGYVLIYKPKHPDAHASGYILFHRFVMEKKIGRRLLPQEVVHHKDGNPSNNKLNNLELLPSKTDHIKLHWREGDHVAPFQGRKHTASARAKMSASRRGNQNRKGIPHTPEIRAQISATQTGKKRKPHSDEAKQRISQALKGRTLRPGGWRHSPESLQKMSEAAKRREERKRQRRLADAQASSIPAASTTDVGQ